MAENPNSIADPNGSRLCNQRWNHREEVTVLDKEIEWCPVCLTVSNTPTN